MKLRKYAKITLVLFLIGIIATSLSVVFGASIPSAGTDGSGASTAVEKIVGALILIIQIVAFAAAVIMLMFLGIKYITASPDGKAEIKKSAVIYVVGALLVFFAGLILGWIKDINFK